MISDCVPPLLPIPLPLSFSLLLPHISSSSLSLFFLDPCCSIVSLAVILALINSFSPKGVVRVAEALSSVKFLALLFIAVLGLYKIIATNGTIFVENSANLGTYSWNVYLVHFFLAIYAANWAYDGW